MRRILAGLMIMVLVLGLLPLSALAAQYSDIAGHWAEEQISIWLEKELAGGYPDGTFRPNQPVTRAEFAAFSNRAFAIPAAAAGPSFADVSETAWFYADVAAAAEAGFMSGYPDGTFRPNNPITRQEAAAVLVGLLDLEAGAGKDFADQDAIAAWAEDAVEAVSAAGIMGGYPDGSFRPANSMTRAETVVTLEKGTGYGDVLAAAVVFDQPGVYGPQSGSETITGNAIIMAAGVTLQNYIITGDLTIAKEVGDGDVTLNNITVKGDTNIRGGGTESIHINGGQYNNIIIEETPSGGVRVVAVGVDGLKVTVAETVAGEKVVLEGEFEKVTVQAKDVNIETQGETKIAEIIITETASNINVTTSDKTVIEKAVLDGEGTTFTGGKDTIKAVEGSQSDSYADQGSVVAPPAPPPSGGGGSSERRVAVSAISVDEPFLLVKADENEPTDVRTIIATVTPANASNKRVTWSSSDETVATVDNNGVVTGITGGTATITVTSVADTTKKATVYVVVGDLLVPAGWSIQDVIDDAEAGQVIAVAPAEYKEQLVIDKPLTLLGPNAGIAGDSTDRLGEATITYPEQITDTSDKSLIRAVSSNVTVKGFYFENSDLYVYEAGDIYEELYFEGENIIFENNRVKVLADKLAIRIRGPIPESTQLINVGPYDGAVISNNYIEGLSNTNGTVYVQGIGGVVENNVIIGSINGLQVQPYGNEIGGVVKNNEIAAYVYPIWHNYHHINGITGVHGKWTYESNILTPYEPENRSGYQDVPYRWRAFLVMTAEPNIELVGNTFDGSNAFENGVIKSVWANTIGILWSNVNNQSIFDINNNTMLNVTIGAQDDAGNADLNQILLDNTFLEGSMVIGSKIMVPEENVIYNMNTGEEYETVQAAIDAAGDGDTIVLGSNTNVTEKLLIASSKNITLDLNGKTISGTDTNTTGNFELIENCGNLTIEDSSAEQTGMITLSATNNRGWTAASTTVLNNLGSLTISSGAIKHTGGTDMAYAIDTRTNGGSSTATLTVDGGSIESPYRAIRAFQNSTGDNSVIVNGGSISAGRDGSGGGGIWMHQSGASSKGTLTITGGEIYGKSNAVVTDIDNDGTTTINISGGTFANGKETANLMLIWPFSTKEAAGTAIATMSISGGTFIGTGTADTLAILNLNDDQGTIVVSGGTFTSDPSAYLADAYQANESDDGTWVVEEIETK